MSTRMRPEDEANLSPEMKEKLTLFRALEPLMEMAGMCTHECSHGGICELSANHEGPHDTGYCTWES